MAKKRAMAKKKATKKAAKKVVKKAAKKAAARKAAPRARKTAKKAAGKAATKAARKAPAKKARKVARKAAPPKAAPKKAAPKKAAPKKAAAKKAPAARSAPPKRGKAARPAHAARPAPIRGAIPSSLDLGGGPSAARSGREEMLQHIKERNETSPAITAGDVDADWQQAYSSGDEAPGGDNPTPDQDVVDEIGEALGVEYDDDEELKGAPKIEARDKHRWELDPASKEDLDEE